MTTFDTDNELGTLVPPLPAPYDAPELEDQLVHLRAVVAAARQVPFSTASMVQKEELLALLDDTLANLPDDLRAARWLLREREDFLDRVRREGEEIIVAARRRAERLGQRNELVKSAEARAAAVVDRAEADARRLRREAEEYCDERLSVLQASLQRGLAVVVAGRERLASTTLHLDDPLIAAETTGVTDEHRSEEPGGELFDQDER